MRIGSEFRIDTSLGDFHWYSSVASDNAGNFVVTWMKDGSTVGPATLLARRYDSAGVAVGSDFQVNTHTTSQKRIPSVSVDETGNFVVVWPSDGQDGDGYGVFGQRNDGISEEWNVGLSKKRVSRCAESA